MSGFYKLEGPESPWADYSDILVHGMSCHLSRKKGRIQLERTGPYVPPVSFPGMGDIVVTDTFKHKLESSGLDGLCFQPVTKKRIVRLDWHLWEKSSEEPAEYPESGEPEDYILTRPHSPEMSDSMEDLWEVVLKTNATTKRGQSCVWLVADSWRGGDLFRAEGVDYNYATDKARVWFEKHAGEFVTFEEADVV